eukprot:TRINITY_DN8341_c0_g3_i1.p1 TRINITY_DN8341_c0_g3~~TRINITY_DN8341_c0_g3_i1.p1  ORF type:complete len:1155 (+),score=394.08 TRINITY_DN8341_c0_g3_i1:23-3466(+)
MRRAPSSQSADVGRRSASPSSPGRLRSATGSPRDMPRQASRRTPEPETPAFLLSGPLSQTYGSILSVSDVRQMSPPKWGSPPRSRSPVGGRGSPSGRSGLPRHSSGTSSIFPGSAAGAGPSSKQNVQVYVRVRPFNDRELKIQDESADGERLRAVLDIPHGPTAELHVLDHTEEFQAKEAFVFDRVLWSIPAEQQPLRGPDDFADQVDVFETVGRPALENAWNGFHTCIFAYGQTGAGKTHTMVGPFTVSDGVLGGDPGVIPRLCKELYAEVEEKREKCSEEDTDRLTNIFEIELSAYEVYNEKVRDLFFMRTPGRSQKDELRVRWHPTDGHFVDDLSHLKPASWQECIADIQESYSFRTVGATAMNAESSRSHCVYQLKFTQVQRAKAQSVYDKPITNRKFSVINLVDLAGSERNKKSQAQGERLVEANSINLSLATLKRVIDALVYNSNHERKVNIPYRDSVLTKLLSHSLGGNSKTVMIAAVSPHFDNTEETVNTLRYASNARKIVNVVRTNEDSLAKLKLGLIEQMQAMQDKLNSSVHAPDADPEELAQLRRGIELSKEELRKTTEQAAQLGEQLAQIQELREEEQRRQKDMSFQHAFRQVVLRKQKLAAQRQVEEMAKERMAHAAEEAAKREQEERQKREQVRAQAERIESLEREAEAHRDEVSSLKNKHEAQLRQMLEDSDQIYKDLAQRFSDEAGEMRGRIAELERDNERLRSVSTAGLAAEASLAKAEEYRMMLVEEQASARKREEEQRKQFVKCTREADRKVEQQLTDLRAELSRVRRKLGAAEDRLREEKLRGAESLRAAEADHAAERSELLCRIRDAEDELSSKPARRKSADVKEQAAATMAAEAAARADDAAAAASQVREELAAARAEAQRLRDELAAAKERSDEQRVFLEEVSRREQGYRNLASDLSRTLALADDDHVDVLTPPGAKSESLAGALELKLKGLQVTSVDEGGYGEAHGIRTGMRLVSVNGRAPQGPAAATAEWAAAPQQCLLRFAAELSPDLRHFIRSAKEFQEKLESAKIPRSQLALLRRASSALCTSATPLVLPAGGSLRASETSVSSRQQSPFPRSSPSQDYDASPRRRHPPAGPRRRPPSRSRRAGSADRQNGSVPRAMSGSRSAPGAASVASSVSVRHVK